MKLFLCFCLVLLSCKLTENDRITQKTFVTDVQVESVTGKTIVFKNTGEWHDGCGKFSHYETVESDSGFYFTLYGSQPKDAICTQALISFDAPLSITVPASGTYTFSFYAGKNDIDTTLTIQ